MFEKPDNEAICEWLLTVASLPDDDGPTLGCSRTILRLMALYNQVGLTRAACLGFADREKRVHMAWILNSGGAGALFLARIITGTGRPEGLIAQAHALLHVPA